MKHPLFFALLSSAYLFACSEFTITGPNVVVTARTFDVQPQITNPGYLLLNPRGVTRTTYSVGDAQGLTWTSIYGSVTVNPPVASPFPSVDGINEKGLGAASLWKQPSAYPDTPSAPILSDDSIVQYCLDNFATVQEAVTWIQSGNVRVTPNSGTIYGTAVVTPLHISLHDASNDSALIEFDCPGGNCSQPGIITVYHPITDNPPNEFQVNVVTNGPDYTDHLSMLAQYGYFGGALALPGSNGSNDRFTRLAAWYYTMQPSPENQTSAASAISNAFSAIYNAVEPLGSLEGDGDLSGTCFPTPTAACYAWPTQIITVRDNVNLVYYCVPRPFDQLCFVDLKKINFSSNQTTQKTLFLSQSNLVSDVTLLLLTSTQSF